MPAPRSKLRFEIYIAGLTSYNKATIRAFEEVCAVGMGPGSFEIRIIDVLQEHVLAEKKKIIAIPTILRSAPEPEVRVIGNFSDKQSAKEAFLYLTKDML